MDKIEKVKDCLGGDFFKVVFFKKILPDPLLFINDYCQQLKFIELAMVVFLFPFFTEKKEGFNLLQVMNLHLLQLEAERFLASADHTPYM